MFEFSNEQLAAFVMGTLPSTEAEAIRSRVGRDRTLACKLVLMQLLSGVPVAWEMLPEDIRPQRDDDCGEPLALAQSGSMLEPEGTVDEQAIREFFRAVVNEHRSDQRTVSELTNRELVNDCYRAIYGDKVLTMGESLEFYRGAAGILSEMIAAHARHKEVSGATKKSESLPPETVQASQSETTFAVSDSHAELVLSRTRRLQELLDFAPEHGVVYLLSMFAGRTPQETAALLDWDVADVDEALSMAITEVHLGDLAGDQDAADT